MLSNSVKRMKKKVVEIGVDEEEVKVIDRHELMLRIRIADAVINPSLRIK